MTGVGQLERSLSQVFSKDRISPSDTFHSAYFTVFPTDPEQVSELVIMAGKEKITLLPVGGGTRLYKPADTIDVAVSLSKFSHMVEHSPEDLTVTAGAGMAFHSVQEQLSESHQAIPLDPPFTPLSTIGGIVAANAFGPCRHRYGSARDWVTRTELVNGRGDTVKAGAKVVKNVSGYDLNKLYIGSRGTLGILLSVSFKLSPLLQKNVIFTLTCSTAESAFDMANRLREKSLSLESLAIVSGKWSHKTRESWTLIMEIGGTTKSLEKQEPVIQSASSQFDNQFHRASENERHRIRKKLNRVSDSDDYEIRISLTRKQMKSFLKTEIFRETEAVSGKIFPAIGICYLRIPGDFHHVDDRLQEIIEEIQSLGGSIEFESLPHNTEFERWPLIPASLPWMKRIKEALDPHAIFAPGTFIGGI